MSERREIEETETEVEEEFEEITEEEVMEGIELIGLFGGITKLPALKTKTGTTGELVKSVDTTYKAKITIKKIAYDRDENQKAGTADPWMTVTITTYDIENFESLQNASIGDEILVNLNVL